MKKISLVFFMGFSFCSIFAENPYSNILSLLNENKCNEALVMLDKYAKIYTADSNIFYLKGAAYQCLGKVDEAAADLKKGLELDPDSAIPDPGMYMFVGAVESKKGHHENAVNIYDKCIERFPKYADAYRWRAAGKIKLKDFSGALKDMDRAINLSGENIEYFEVRGFLKSTLKDYKGAIDDYTKVVSAPKKNVYFHDIASLKQNIYDYEGAIKAYTACINANPNDYAAYLGRAAVKSKLKDFSGAIADTTAVIKLKPNWHEAYYSRGLYRMDAGDNEGALDDFYIAEEMGDPDAGYYIDEIESLNYINSK